MRRLLCIFLILSLLVAYIPATSRSEEKTIPYSLLENAAKKISADTDFSKYSAKRGNDYSYGIPAPLSEGQGAVIGNFLPIRYIMVENGGDSQAMYTLIYKGDSSILNDPNFDDEPVAYDKKDFTRATTLRQYTTWFNTTGTELGTYTVLTFTVVNNSQIVESTAAYVEIYVLNKSIPLQGYTLTNVDTGETVTKVNLSYPKEGCYSVSRIPSITTDTSEISYSVDSDSSLEVQAYHGLFFFYPKDFGRTVLQMGNASVKLTTTIDVCMDDLGHVYQNEHIRDASKYGYGCSIHSCHKCYFAYVQYDKTLQQAFKDFNDVLFNEWYYQEVQTAVHMGLFNGLSAEKFGPGDTMTRAMLVTVLWRYAGKPIAEITTEFSDVPKGQWYSNAVTWAAEKGIVTGMGNGRFAPNDTITREQMATILYRFAEQIELDTSARAELTQFNDGHLVSPWATDALQWAVAEGIIGGSLTNGILSVLPANGATRAQVAAVLVRTLEKLPKPYYEIEIPDCAVKGQGVSKDYLWTVYEDGTLVLEKNSGTEPTAWTWYNYRFDIKCVKVLQGVEYVGSLKELPALKEVILADSVYSVSSNAFQNCTALESVRFPDTLRIIGSYAFENCTSLKSIELPKNLGGLGDYCFAKCTSLTELRLPDGLQSSIGGTGSFSGCTALETVTLGKGIDAVSQLMFQGCTALRTVEFATGITTLQYNSFADCISLEEVVLPVQLQRFYDSAFAGCTRLRKVTILNPYVQLATHNKDNTGNPVYSAPFDSDCEIYGYTGSTAQELAKHFGNRFYPIDK